MERNFLFTDESCITNPDKQFSSICAVSGSAKFFGEHKRQITSILRRSEEYKFQKLNKETKDDLLELCDQFLFPAINNGDMRIDTLIWDNHLYKKDQDIMHYHLLSKVLQKYPHGIEWHYYPDQDLVKNYGLITEIVNTAVNSKTPYELALENLAQEYAIRFCGAVDSKDYRLVQIADVFAGVAAFSYNNYSDYTDWLKNTTGSLSFDFAQKEISNNKTAKKQNHKFQFLDAVNTRCKKFNKYHSLKSKHGLCSFGPDYGMNFWFWDNDRSVLKGR